MIYVVGGWELSWNTPIKEAELWAFPMRDYEVQHWRMWPVSGIRNLDLFVELTEYPDLSSSLEDLQHLTWVFLEPRNAAYQVAPDSMADFDHPDDVVYVFGSAHFNPIVAGLPRAGDHIIEVPTVRNQGAIWPHQILVTVLYDRLVKSWRS